MRKFFKNLHRQFMKEDARKFGINLVTACMVGGFITHVANWSMLAIVLLFWVGILGIGCWLFGVYQEQQE